MQNNEIVIFETEDKLVTLPVAIENETVWLSANQMAVLFGRDEKTIRKHMVLCQDLVQVKMGFSSS